MKKEIDYNERNELLRKLAENIGVEANEIREALSDVADFEDEYSVYKEVAKEATEKYKGKYLSIIYGPRTETSSVYVIRVESIKFEYHYGSPKYVVSGPGFRSSGDIMIPHKNLYFHSNCSEFLQISNMKDAMSFDEYLIDEKELRDIVQRELGKMESYTNLLFN